MTDSIDAKAVSLLPSEAGEEWRRGGGGESACADKRVSYSRVASACRFTDVVNLAKGGLFLSRYAPFFPAGTKKVPLINNFVQVKSRLQSGPAQGGGAVRHRVVIPEIRLGAQ